MTEVEQPPQNGIDLSAAEEDDINKARPADIEQDVREMERRKRVEAIMGSKLFREELERIVDCARDNGNTDGLFQQLSDIVGVPASRVGSVFKSSNCMVPINDIRGVESMGYAKGEKILRCKLAAAFRLLDLNGWTQGLGAQITARLKVDQEYFLVNPYGLLYHEITASSLNKVDMQGNIVEQGTTNFGVNKSHFVLHSIVHAARPDIRCAIYIGCSPVVAIASLKAGLLPLTKDACVLGELSTFNYTGYLNDEEERIKLVRNLGPNSKVMLLTNHGALCCGETIEEAFFAACHIVQACETQLKLLPVGLDNLVLINEEARKMIYEQSRRPPEDLEKKFAASAITDTNKSEEVTKDGEEKTTTTTTTVTTQKVIGQPPKWRVGGAEFEALMRMLDNAGYRTGYIYRHPLIKSDPPKPKNDVELPPAVSSLGYLLEEEELFRQGIWKKGDIRKGGDRSRWLNSPNVYQKVEVLETGTPDPKKITKWVADSSPTHSTPVRIDDPLQFVPVNTNPREFKRLQQQIKDNRRADKISAGPQSHILEGVTWDEANRIKDATVSSAGDHVVLMGAASKGIIQRGFQHNATVYKTPYAKNPFDNVTDDELNEYKRTVERKKKSIHGEYTDTDFSESEALSSLQTSGTQQQTKQTTTTTTTTTAAVSQSEPEDISEHQVMRIQTQQAPVPSQPEVVLSDASLSFINGERSHMVTNRKPPTGRDAQILVQPIYQVPQDPYNQESLDISCHSMQLTPYQSALDDVSARDEEDISCSADHHHHDHHRQAFITNTNNSFIHNSELIHELKSDSLFQKQKDKFLTPTNNNTQTHLSGNGNFDNISPQYLSPLRSKCKINRLGGNNAKPDNSSYYSCCYDTNTNNTSCKTSSDGCSNIYDIASSNISSDYINPRKNYTKSPDCQTPLLCEAILESLQKPSNMSASHQDLLWNRAFLSQGATPFSTPEIQNTPRKARGDHVRRQSNLGKKSHSPYRTVSHFGFNSPQREPEPDHKHVPINTDPKKYVPLRRSISCEEVFSSPRYLDLCEHCFELIVRSRLRNLAENYVQPEPPMASHHNSPLAKHISSNDEETVTPNLVITTTDSSCPADMPLSEEDSPQEEGPSIFNYQLETVIEVEERDSSEDHLTNSTFIDRITRMNYSEESSNLNYLNTPHTVSSHQSLAEIEEDYDDNNTPSPDHINESFQRLHLNEEESEDCNNNLDIREDKREHTIESFVSVTEIWDFANWLESVMEETPSNENLENFTENLKTTETQTGKISVEDKAAPALTINHELENQPSRLLMNREERTRRKLEFQEIWEDHVRCGENREQSGMAGSFSDTESAIDETQHPTNRPRNEQTEEDDDNQIEQISLNDEDIETFEGSSLVIAQIYHSSENNEPALKNSHDRYEENFDQEDYASTSSRLTYNISEENSSEENLLFRKLGSTNLAARLNMSGAHGQIDKSFNQKLDLNINLEEDYDMEDDVDNLKGIQSEWGLKTSFEKETQEKTEETYEEFAKSYSETSNSGGITCTESEMHLKEFNDIVRQQYDVHSNVSENFEAITCYINFNDDHEEGNQETLQNTQICDKESADYQQIEINQRENKEQLTLNVNEENKENEDLTESVDCQQIDEEINQREINEQQTLIEKEEKKEKEDLTESAAYEQKDEEINRNEKLTLNDNEENKENEDLTESAAYEQIDEDINQRASSENEDQQFSFLERKILEKIEINQLSKSEKIFDKIENSIRNKMTPSKLELLIKEQALRLCHNSSCSSDNDDTIYKLTSTPNKDVESLLGKSFDISNFFQKDEQLYRRSQSLSQLSDPASPLAKLNKTSMPTCVQQNKQPSSARSSPNTNTPSPCSSKTSINSNTKRRNFILENIRNASVPRHTPQIKRLQGNTQAIFGKNPFGPRNPTTVNSAKKSDQQQIDCNLSTVYSFQSKLVKGSPRFWVSMTQSPNEKLPQTCSPRKPKRNRKSLTQSQKSARKNSTQLQAEEDEDSLNELIEKTSSLTIDLCVTSSPILATTNADEVTIVDAEINALGEEIQQIQPRLETYKRKLEDFGDRISKCARNMDECVATQEEIANEQRELKERLILQQFSEKISCRSETYSLSETED